MSIQQLFPDMSALLPNFPKGDTQEVINEWNNSFSQEITTVLENYANTINQLIAAYRYAVRVLTGAYTISELDAVLIANAAGGSFQVTLMSAIGVTGKVFIFKLISANSLTIAAQSGQTIDGAATQVLSSQYAKLTVVSDGSNWQIIA